MFLQLDENSLSNPNLFEQIVKNTHEQPPLIEGDLPTLALDRCKQLENQNKKVAKNNSNKQKRTASKKKKLNKNNSTIAKTEESPIQSNLETCLQNKIRNKDSQPSQNKDQKISVQQFFHKIKQKISGRLQTQKVSYEQVSSLPQKDLNYSKCSSICSSVQKCQGKEGDQDQHLFNQQSSSQFSMYQYSQESSLSQNGSLFSFRTPKKIRKRDIQIPFEYRHVFTQKRRTKFRLKRLANRNLSKKIKYPKDAIVNCEHTDAKAGKIGFCNDCYHFLRRVRQTLKRRSNRYVSIQEFKQKRETQFKQFAKQKSGFCKLGQPLIYYDPQVHKSQYQDDDIPYNYHIYQNANKRIFNCHHVYYHGGALGLCRKCYRLFEFCKRKISYQQKKILTVKQFIQNRQRFKKNSMTSGGIKKNRKGASFLYPKQIAAKGKNTSKIVWEQAKTFESLPNQIKVNIQQSIKKLEKQQKHFLIKLIQCSKQGSKKDNQYSGIKTWQSTGNQLRQTGSSNVGQTAQISIDQLNNIVLQKIVRYRHLPIYTCGHYNKGYYARGLCRNCYQNYYLRNRNSSYRSIHNIDLQKQEQLMRKDQIKMNQLRNLDVQIKQQMDPIKRKQFFRNQDADTYSFTQNKLQKDSSAGHNRNSIEVEEVDRIRKQYQKQRQLIQKQKPETFEQFRRKQIIKSRLKVPRCGHITRKYGAKGFCIACYQWIRSNLTRMKWPTPQEVRNGQFKLQINQNYRTRIRSSDVFPQRRNICGHQYRRYYASGNCRSCYLRSFQQKKKQRIKQDIMKTVLRMQEPQQPRNRMSVIKEQEQQSEFSLNSQNLEQDLASQQAKKENQQFNKDFNNLIAKIVE